jgi:drug/metabolite transporter (DMT)-like permease
MAIFRDARRGWNFSVVWRTGVLGTLLSGGMILQHLGLDRTSEAVSAFLTSLTILFVPLIMTAVLRRPPPAIIWVGVVVAGAGVWLMTGASPGGSFGLGELLGLGCAIVYSADIIAVNLLVKPGDVAKVTGGQFFFVAAVSVITLLLIPGGRASLSPAQAGELLRHAEIGVHVALLAVLVSMGAFGIQFTFQPHLDPSRAALIYLFEPIFASAYAWVATGRRLDAVGMIGAALILVANVIVEFLQSRKRSAVEEPAAVAAPVID